MLLQAEILLYKLKKAQPAIDGFIWIDTENKRALAVVEKGQNSICVDLSKNWAAVMPLMSILKKENLIVQTGYEHFRITPQGFYYFSDKFSNIFLSMFKFTLVSFVFPVIVSIITTLATLYIYQIIPK